MAIVIPSILENVGNRLALTSQLICALSLCLIAGCSGGFTDGTKEVHSQSIELPNRTYGSPVWLDDDVVAFLYKRDEEDESPWGNRISLLTLRTGEWQELPVPARHETCSADGLFLLGNLNRVPDGNLGFIYRCTLESSGDKPVLYMWSRKTNSLHLLQDYPEFFHPTDFAVEPNGRNLIQAAGGSGQERLYYVSGESEMEQLAPHFQRATEPAYSSDGRMIAFRGTETYPGGPSEDLTTWPEIEGLLFYPWDLYTMDAEGNNIRLILSGIEEPGGVQWVPGHDDLLSFSGNYQDTPGIWTVDIETNKVTRIWPDRTSFSWAPDGNRIITFDLTENDSQQSATPVIADGFFNTP